MALTTYTWTSVTGGVWTTAANWQGSSAPPTTGSAAQNAVVDLSTATSGPITLFAGTATTGVINAGAVSLTADATLDIYSGQTLFSGSGAAPAGDNFVINAGTVDLFGGMLEYGTVTVGGSGEIIGFGTLQNPQTPGGVLSTSGGGEIVAFGSGDTLLVGSTSVGNSWAVSGGYEITTGATLEFFNSASLSTASLPIINFTSAADDLYFAPSIGNNSPYIWTISGGFNTLRASLENLAVGQTAGSSAGASEITFNIGSGHTINSAGIVNGSTIHVSVDNGHVFVLNTNGSFTDDFVDFTLNGSMATVWVDNACYVAGTHIMTEHGELAVEELAEGDMVVTLAGDTRSLRPVKWIGQRRLNLLQHPQPNLSAPVRVRRQAFGQGLPSRDLLLSPDHCLFVDGKLIPAKLLINDMTIVQERETASVDYYHVELDQHSVLLAEGLPAESYLDTGNRAMFANAGLDLVLHPEFAVNAALKCWETDACAPLAVSQDAVKPIWDGLVERALLLGYRRPEYVTTDDPDLRLVADGRVIRPLSNDANTYVFMVPAGVSSVRLASRTSVPSYFEAYLDDWRPLGVAIRRIVVRDSASLTEIPPDHPGLTQGWYQVERGGATMWRWMNGDAVLPIRQTDGPTMVEVQVGAAMKHIVEVTVEGRLAA